MNLKELMNERYSVKKFDTTKEMDEKKLEELKEILIQSPSSVNIQPWQFLIANDLEAKQRIAKSTKSFGFNTQKILDAQAIIVFCVKDVDNEYLDKILDKEDKDGRYLEPKFKEELGNGRKMFFNLHKNELNDDKEWLTKQVYLNIGHFVLGAKTIGIDSVIMEGFDTLELDKELSLSEKGLSSIALVAVGYAAEDDFNKSLPKSRLSKDDLVTIIK